ncbi:MAG: DUF6067 family protein [Steroidobacteraceae bacterium]
MFNSSLRILTCAGAYKAQKRRVGFLVCCVAVLVSLSGTGVPVAQAQISAVWANDGGDKVMQHELRASKRKVINSVWTGRAIQLFGARNEVVSFNLVLEAGQGARNVSVQFDELTGPDGARIGSRSVTGDGVFNYVDRDIEVFYVRYLQVKGLSRLGYDVYDERHIPAVMRRPFSVDANNRTVPVGGWPDRPGADKYFPDIAVPMELHPRFDIEAQSNQSVWVDIYIPKSRPAGSYSGVVTITEAGVQTIRVPVSLSVESFVLPDRITSKTMLALDPYDIAERIAGKRFPDRGNVEYTVATLARDRAYLLARRHRVTLAGGDYPDEAREIVAPPSDSYVKKLDGSFFTDKNGYAGPGENTGLDLYVIGPYGGATWARKDRATVHRRMNEWEQYFHSSFPEVDRFLYDVDEPNLNDSETVREINARLDNYKSNPGIGRNLKIFSTVYVDQGTEKVPRYDIMAQWMAVGDTAVIQRAVDLQRSRGGEVWHYNGKRIASGTYMTEDEGTSPRMIPWAQYKLGLGRQFYYAAGYYYDYQTSGKRTNVFRSARTYGVDDKADPIVGRTGWNYSNGDGVLMYPARDSVYPEESYGLTGLFASLRLKHWRRGIQDVEYLALAAKKDPARVNALVKRMVPSVYWEVGVETSADPSWKLGDISWSIDPDVWESARRELAQIINRTGNVGNVPEPPKAFEVK